MNYDAEAIDLRAIYVNSPPSARFGVILKRLEVDEIGPVRLVSLVSAVEALTRSVLVHAKFSKLGSIEKAYKSIKYKEAVSLVDELCVLRALGPPKAHFSEDTWELFNSAVDFRNLVVHECTFLGQDKYPSLISAVEEVLDWVARQEGLL